MARSQPVATGTAAIVIAAVCAVVLVTAGQVAAAQERVLAQIDDAGTRLIVVSDPTGQAQIGADSVAEVQSLSGVSWAFGIGPATDAVNSHLGAAGQPVPARQFHGDLPVAIVAGRTPLAGEAIVGPDALARLGARYPSLGIQTALAHVPVVGAFRADGPLEFLNRSILIDPGTASDRVREVYVVAESAADVEPLDPAIRAVIRAEEPSQVIIGTAAVLGELRTIVGAELAVNARRITLMTLTVGLLIVSTTIAGAVSLRRRDFGRRRALGASRSTIVILVLVQILVAAVAGVGAGVIGGVIALWRLAGVLPSAPFVGAVAVLAIVMAFAAGVLPGMLAAARDPVRILRIP